MDLSIVIVSYNTREITRRCLSSILRHTKEIDYEVIVVDNASSDGSVQMIQKDFPSVRLICHRQNRGFAAAQNAGLLDAMGRHLLVLNSDVLFIGNVAKSLVNRLQKGPPDLGAVGPQILNGDGTVAASARRALPSRMMIGLGILNRHFNLKRFLPEAFMRRHLGFVLGKLHDNYAGHDAQKQVEYVDGMCLLIKREVLNQTGLFDEQFFFDFEIIDLSNRIRKYGWRIEYFPAVQVIHLAHSSRRRVSSIIVETHRSELAYYAKYAPKDVAFVRSVVLMVVALKARWVKAGLFFGWCERSKREVLRLYEEIMTVCHGFVPGSVWESERIPLFLPKQGPQAKGAVAADNSAGQRRHRDSR